METPLRLAAVAAVAAVLAVPAHAGAPPPTDVEAAAAGPALATILPTSLFALGEVDLALLGVSDAELADVGPTASPDPETDGDNLLIVDDGADCPNADYPTIQSAVNAADSGDRIKVCRGTYEEQVTIPATKNDLTLFSEGFLQAVISDADR